MPSSSFSIIFNILLIIQIVLTSSTQNSQIRQLAHRRHKRDFMFAAGNSTDPMPSCFQSADRVFSPSNFLCTFKRQHFLRARACLEESEPISFLRCDQSCHPGGGHRRAELGKVFGENEMEGYERELEHFAHSNNAMQNAMRKLLLPVMFSIQFMNAIGHILLLERLLATLLSRTYERVKSVYFTAIWSILLCIYCGYTAWEQVMGHSIGQFEISAFIIFSAYFYSGMALAEFFCIIIISGYNGKKFKKQLRNQGQHNLSERFQLKDNIRTARQLGPTFFLHFINIMVSCEFPLVIHYGLITKLSTMQIYSSITHIAITTGNCLIEYTIISRHRILRQNAIHFINRILFKNDRIINIELANTNTTIIQENKAKESEQYFEILKQEWK